MPYQFFSEVIRYLKKSTHLSVQSLDIASQGIDFYKAQLTVSFLGEISFYWLGDISSLLTKDRQAIEWLITYTGPHKILFFSGKQCITNVKSGIELPVSITNTIVHSLSTITGNFDPCTLKEVTAFYSKMPTGNLDNALFVLYYHILIGTYDISERQQFLERILVPDQPLFKLSKSFFSKNETTFFRFWAEMKAIYPAPFWLVFWSEQLWRAFFYVQYMTHENYSDAKIIGQRLPYSFLQKDWRTISLDELQEAHSFIVDFDAYVKNGGNEIFFDLFYLKFFSGHFLAPPCLTLSDLE